MFIQFFRFGPSELLEYSTHIKKLLPYSYAELYININKIVMVKRHNLPNIDTSIYKIQIGERDFYIKEDVFQRLKCEVLDAE